MQDNIANYLQYESSKYGDLPSIIAKLEKQGYLDQINSLFEKLYQEEASYTLQGKIGSSIHLLTQIGPHHSLKSSQSSLSRTLIMRNLTSRSNLLLTLPSSKATFNLYCKWWVTLIFHLQLHANLTSKISWQNMGKFRSIKTSLKSTQSKSRLPKNSSKESNGSYILICVILIPKEINCCEENN